MISNFSSKSINFGVFKKILIRINMKLFTEQQVDDLIKLKFGKLVTTPSHTSYASNRVLGKIFGVSGSQIRKLYRARFDKISD